LRRAFLDFYPLKTMQPKTRFGFHCTGILTLLLATAGFAFRSRPSLRHRPGHAAHQRPNIFGVRPSSPVLYPIPATGRRPMTFSATGLPPD